MTATAGRRLVGRDDEIHLLRERLDAIGARPVVTGLEGEPGSGKTALLAEIVAEARSRGVAVIMARGSEAEANLPFAALHQLLRPLLHKVDQLSTPQRRALLACFAMGEDDEVNPLFVSLATLELLVEHALGAPVLVALDDVDRMDGPSVDVLGFVVRRLQGERVGVVCTSRPPALELGDGSTDEWVGLDGLDVDSSTELLRSRSTRLSTTLEQRVVREAGGNPLALLEFASALEAGRLTWTDLDDDLPMTSRLETAFAVRAGELDHAARAVVDVAAVDDGSSLGDVLAAATILHGAALGPEALSTPQLLGLLTVSGDQCRIASPLVGSALRQTMSASRRRQAHAALAEVLVADRDRAIWHRAAAVQGRDEQVATDLERAAADARRRGAVATAVAWLDRAAALSPAPESRASRLLGAAELAFELGRFDQVEEIKARVAGTELSLRDRSRLTWLEGAFHDGSSSEPAEVSRLVGLARRATVDGDVDLALQLLFGAARRVWWRDPGDDVRAEIMAAVRQVPLPARDPRILAAMGLAESFDLSPTVIEQLGAWPSDADGRPDLAGLLGIAAFCVGEFDRAEVFLTIAIQELRAHGRLSLLAEALAIRAWAEVNLGVFDPARSAEEAVRLGDETGQAVWAATARIAVAVADGVAGRWDPRHALLAEAEHTAVRMPNASSSLLAGVQQARGMAELGADRPEQAYGELRRIFMPDDPAFQRVQQLWAVGYLADAAVRTGRRDDAQELLGAAIQLAGPTPASGYAVALEYAGAVLADDVSAEAAFGDALAGGASCYPWHRARLQLAQGSWLRRRRRAVESREPLRAARGTFAALGAGTWAARADQELRAAGEPGWQPVASPREHLSAQEAQIAELAAQGLSNREIGQRLFVSHRTVGSHLYRIFPKLGITSRNQLAVALAPRD
ncbi:MAG TPA: LuxR family transcriptional regulator [Nocardioides sp.]|uniref:LuxR family transcriptional regulator n=1 Tax=Nocardioides sp. TaxID=35761 RepID=UPI002E37A49A|nr:LuxR family transcriptional regulator [Nocardioides sp.]HEX5087828.1 LuxR family transcriptional regulator [Nocardioides sp.]